MQAIPIPIAVLAIDSISEVFFEMLFTAPLVSLNFGVHISAPSKRPVFAGAAS